MEVKEFARLYQRETGVGLPFSGTDDEILQALIIQWKKDRLILEKYSGLVFEIAKFDKITKEIIRLKE